MWTYQPTDGSRTFASPWFERPNRLIDKYLEHFSQFDFHRSIFYALAILVFGIIGWRQGDRSRLVVALGLGTVLYTLSYFFLITVTDNRFNWPMIVVGILSAAGLAQCVFNKVVRFRVSREPASDPRGPETNC
jgi:hypothetical protein